MGPQRFHEYRDRETGFVFYFIEGQEAPVTDGVIISDFQTLVRAKSRWETKLAAELSAARAENQRLREALESIERMSEVSRQNKAYSLKTTAAYASHAALRFAGVISQIARAALAPEPAEAPE